MAGVGRSQFAGGDLQDPHPQRHKHLGGVVVHHLFVDRLEDLCRVVAPALGPVVDHDLRGHHEHGRGDALAGHVRDDERQVIPVDHIVIVEVAPQLLGRLHPGVDVKFLSVREGGIEIGDHVLLDALGQFQFHGDALRLFDLLVLLKQQDSAALCDLRADQGDQHQQDQPGQIALHQGAVPELAGVDLRLAHHSVVEGILLRKAQHGAAGQFQQVQIHGPQAENHREPGGDQQKHRGHQAGQLRHRPGVIADGEDNGKRQAEKHAACQNRFHLRQDDGIDGQQQQLHPFLFALLPVADTCRRGHKERRQDQNAACLPALPGEALDQGQQDHQHNQGRSAQHDIRHKEIGLHLVVPEDLVGLIEVLLDPYFHPAAEILPQFFRRSFRHGVSSFLPTAGRVLHSIPIFRLFYKYNRSVKQTQHSALRVSSTRRWEISQDFLLWNAAFCCLCRTVLFVRSDHKILCFAALFRRVSALFTVCVF